MDTFFQQLLWQFLDTIQQKQTWITSSCSGTPLGILSLLNTTINAPDSFLISAMILPPLPRTQPTWFAETIILHIEGPSFLSEVGNIILRCTCRMAFCAGDIPSLGCYRTDAKANRYISHHWLFSPCKLHTTMKYFRVKSMKIL